MAKSAGEQKTKWVHLIGVVGVTMAPVAAEFKRLGWFVTGSDKGFFPPMSTYLIDKNITVEVGFREEHLTKKYYKGKLGGRFIENVGEKPDLIVLGNAIASKNPELLFAQKNKLVIRSFPEILEEYEILKGKSVVVVGTFAKTTTTGLLVHIFQTAKKDISYMIGALTNEIEDGVRFKDANTQWSITEGDEYVSSIFDQRSKFFHYHPDYLVLTSAQLDHTDVYPTEEDYINNFKKLVESVPQNGLIVASKNGKNVDKVIENAKAKVIFYEYDEQSFEFEEKLVGRHNRENIVAAATLARNLDIPSEAIKKAVSTFTGVKRRLEVKLNVNDTVVIDDFGSTPAKAPSSIEAVKTEFKGYKIYVIFEPNAGSRTEEAVPLYENVFMNANEVIIPRLSTIKAREGEKRLGGKELMEVIKKTHKKALYFPDDEALLEYVSKLKGKKVILFMGSHGFRGMIEKTVSLLSTK